MLWVLMKVLLWLSLWWFYNFCENVLKNEEVDFDEFEWIEKVFRMN